MEEIIKTLEESISVWEASKKLGLSRQTIYRRLKENNLKVIKKSKLQVVPE